MHNNIFSTFTMRRKQPKYHYHYFELLITIAIMDDHSWSDLTAGVLLRPDGRQSGF